MFSVEDIKKELNKLSAIVDDEFNIPVGINGRLTRTLGRVHIERSDGVWYPVRMEFSRQFLESSTDASIISVIQHEWCHYYVAKSTGESHGHDNVFKNMCARVRTMERKQKWRELYLIASYSNIRYSVLLAMNL